MTDVKVSKDGLADRFIKKTLSMLNKVVGKTMDKDEEGDW